MGHSHSGVSQCGLRTTDCNASGGGQGEGTQRVLAVMPSYWGKAIG
jgi:hypothetical protein